MALQKFMMKVSNLNIWFYTKFVNSYNLTSFFIFNISTKLTFTKIAHTEFCKNLDLETTLTRAWIGVMVYLGHEWPKATTSVERELWAGFFNSVHPYPLSENATPSGK